MRLRWFVVAGILVAASLTAVSVWDRAPLRSEYCVAEVEGVRAQIDLEQAQWSALMAGIAQQRGLPPRATTIAIATAFQESKIHNIDYGDRDSLGLFQQRPSQGWGTAAQVQDPVHAIGAFYDALVKVPGYTELEITDAAQKVQRSAFPGAYAQHEDYARALASALRGYSPGRFTCQINPGDSGSITQAVDDLQAAFGDIDVRVTGDDARYVLTGEPDDVSARGWGIAHYLVAQAANLAITEVSFADLVWTADQSDQGWRKRVDDPQPSIVRFSTN